MKAEELIKKCWQHNVECEECPIITDSDFEEALKEVRQTRRAMVWYFISFTVFVFTVVCFN